MCIFNAIVSVSLILIYNCLCIKSGRDMWMLPYNKILCYSPLACHWMAPIIQRYIAFNNESLPCCCFPLPSSKILFISQYFHPESINKKKKVCFIAVTSEGISSYSTLEAIFSERSDNQSSFTLEILLPSIAANTASLYGCFITLFEIINLA